MIIYEIKRSSCSFFTGTTGEINKEMDGQILLKRAIKRFEGGGISNVGTTIVNVEVTIDYPLVSAISMIAPSPDWFVGVRDYSLCNTTTGKWVDKRERRLPLYDSGTDSAVTFIHKGTPTNPHVSIFLITKIPENSLKSDTLLPFGTFTFEKTSELIPRLTSNVSPPNQATVTGTKSGSTIGNVKLIASSVLSSIMSPSVAGASTTIKPSSTRDEASSVQHLGVFVLLELIILNLFFTNILN